MEMFFTPNYIMSFICFILISPNTVENIRAAPKPNIPKQARLKSIAGPKAIALTVYFKKKGEAIAKDLERQSRIIDE